MSATTKLGRVGLVLRGAYDAAAAYSRMDVVTYEGCAYAALKDTTGSVPTDAACWQPLADIRPALEEMDGVMESAKSAEQTRVSSEAERRAAEKARADSEDERRAAEQSRVDSEDARQAAEQTRSGNEAVRLDAEQVRADSEAERKAAEQTRIENEAERQTAESGRERAEEGRAAAEAERADAEQERQSAEEQRAQTFAGYQGEIGSLKDDISAETRRAKKAEDNRIKKFYTSNMGETHIADSDDGAVRNLVIGGKSEQFQGEITLEDGTVITVPNPDYPQEIKSVVNPKLSVFKGGKFLCLFTKGQIEWLIEHYDEWHVTNKFVFYDKYGENGTCRVVICTYDEANDNYRCLFVLHDKSTTNGSYQLGENTLNNFIYCENLSIRYDEYFTKNINADSQETVGLPIHRTAAIPFTLRGIGDVRDELYVYADGSEKLVRRYPDTLDPTMTVAEQALGTPVETILTAEQAQALYDLRTYYGGTNIVLSSDNGVEPVVNFDYACALDSFVEYVKEQQGDTREMIYDMDDRLTQAEVTALEAAIDTQIMAAMMEV